MSTPPGLTHNAWRGSQRISSRPSSQVPPRTTYNDENYNSAMFSSHRLQAHIQAQIEAQAAAQARREREHRLRVVANLLLHRVGQPKPPKRRAPIRKGDSEYVRSALGYYTPLVAEV